MSRPPADPPVPLPRVLRRRAWLGLPVMVGLAAALPGALGAREPDALDSPVLRKVRDTGVIVLGHRINSVPFSYLDTNRRPVGYSIELCERVVDAVRRRLGLRELEIKRVAVTSATRLPLVANGSIDMECGVTTNTAERQKSQAFSVTTFVAASRLLTRRDSGIQSLEDLRGKVVASTIATTSIRYLASVNDSLGLGMRIVAGQDDVDAFHLVQTGQAAAFAMDDVLLRSLLAAAADRDDYSISADALSVEPYGIGLPRGDAVFKRLVDEVLVGLYRSGEIHDIYQRWFLQRVPGRGLNLNLPMSEPLRRAIARPTDDPDPQRYR
jgi:glutamate/aspartate transport system substrate-binding protein